MTVPAVLCRVKYSPSRSLHGVVAVVATGALAFSLVSPSVLAAPPKMSRPTSRPASRPVSPPARAGQRVTIPTDEPVPVDIVGTYTPPAGDSRNRRSPMVILLHAYGEDRSTFDPLVPVLHRAGFAVLAIDLRGHGESVEPAVLKLRERVQQRDPKLFRDMVHDVEAAYRWLARRPEADPARFVLVGASVGGSVALDYAVRDKSVDGVVMMTPGADYLGIDSIASARKYSARRLLLLASQEERQAADEMGHMVSNSKVKIVADKSATSTESADPKALHGTRMFGKVPGIEAAITEFIVEAAGPPSDSPVLASLKGSTFYEQSSRQADQINRDNLRYFSSAAEAEARGYHPPKTRKK